MVEEASAEWSWRQRPRWPSMRRGWPPATASRSTSRAASSRTACSWRWAREGPWCRPAPTRRTLRPPVEEVIGQTPGRALPRPTGRAGWPRGGCRTRLPGAEASAPRRRGRAAACSMRRPTASTASSSSSWSRPGPDGDADPLARTCTSSSAPSRRAGGGRHGRGAGRARRARGGGSPASTGCSSTGSTRTGTARSSPRTATRPCPRISTTASRRRTSPRRPASCTG